LLTLAVAFRRGIIIGSALIVAAFTARAQQTDHYKTSAGDTASCLKEAAQMNSAVIKFGQLASEKGQNAELKQFGEQIERDHKRAQTKLEAIARKHDIVLPTSLDPKCQEEVTKLQGLTGSEFDKEFAKGAVQGHAKAIAHLQKGSVEAKDADVAQYAKDMLAQTKRHQERAREVAKAVGLDQATIASLETQPPEGVGTSGAGTEQGAGQNTSPGERKDAGPQP
jgi:putative membrane protein